MTSANVTLVIIYATKPFYLNILMFRYFVSKAYKIINNKFYGSKKLKIYMFMFANLIKLCLKGS